MTRYTVTLFINTSDVIVRDRWSCRTNWVISLPIFNGSIIFCLHILLSDWRQQKLVCLVCLACRSRNNSVTLPLNSVCKLSSLKVRGQTPDFLPVCRHHFTLFLFYKSI